MDVFFPKKCKILNMIKFHDVNDKKVSPRLQMSFQAKIVTILVASQK